MKVKITVVAGREEKIGQDRRREAEARWRRKKGATCEEQERKKIGRGEDEHRER